MVMTDARPKLSKIRANARRWNVRIVTQACYSQCDLSRELPPHEGAACHTPAKRAYVITDKA